MKTPGELRSGFTTGSAMTAAAVAAYLDLRDRVAILLPGGGTLDIPIARRWPDGAAVVKDGGDDPDVTSGCEVAVTLCPFDGPETEADHVEPCGGGTLVVRGAAGVGRVTRPGLALPVGKSSINAGPRRMLAENMAHAGFGRREGEKLLLSVSVKGGEEIARKTLNPSLGIEGGISILGHSGIVRPFSNAAYARTIVLQLRSIAANGGRMAALTTGNRTTGAVRRDYPELVPEGIVPIADFIRIAVRAAATAKLETLVVGCMAGKLFKYACGLWNTHAHRNRLMLSQLRDFGIGLDGLPLEEMETMGELASRLTPERYREILDAVYERARQVLQEWAGDTRIVLALYDSEGRRLR